MKSHLPLGGLHLCSLSPPHRPSKLGSYQLEDFRQYSDSNCGSKGTIIIMKTL